MADAADVANDYLADLEAYSVAQARKHAPAVVPNGECQNPVCGLDVARGKLYCDSACALEHDKLNARGQA